MWGHSKAPVNAESREYLWNCVGDNKIKADNKSFFDPLLKLFAGMQMMLVDNIDVPNKQANGTVCTLVKIVTTSDAHENLTTVQVNGYTVNCIDCNYVSHLLLMLPDETLFELRPMYRHCIVEFPMQLVEGAPPVVIPGVQINFLQLPILANHATTVHKLQGRTVDSLFINDFNYKGNWVYVALSRLRSLDKLFLRRKLDRTQDLTPNGEIEAMLSFMRANKRLQNFPPDD